MTFLDALSAAGDYMLERAIGSVDAGACIPELGSTCKCGATSCGGGCNSVFTKQRWFYSCFGKCVKGNHSDCCSHC